MKAWPTSTATIYGTTCGVGFKEQVQAHFDSSEKKYGITCYECLQNTGEIVFVPSKWYHAVYNVEDSVAVTQNYCSRVNVEAVCDNMDDPDLATLFGDCLLARNKNATQASDVAVEVTTAPSTLATTAPSTPPM